jgi:nucleoside-diphosphate-sugar epimerase
MRAAAAPLPGATVFLGHPQPLRPGELLRLIADAVSRRYRPFPVPRPALQLLATAGAACWRLGWTPLLDAARLTELRAEGFVCAVDEARRLMDFAAVVPHGEGLAATARWYREAGWL